MSAADPQSIRSGAVERSPTLQQTLLDYSPDPVLFVGGDWHIEYANNQAAQLLPGAVEEIFGVTLWAAFPEFAA